MCLFLEELDVPDNVVIKATAIITAAIGVFVAIGATIGNSIILFVLVKFERLQIPSNLLLGSLCITDLLTGLIVQPLSIVRRSTEAYGRHLCNVRLVCAYFAFLCVVASIINVCLISIDRYFAITMPFWYQARVTNTRYICIISAIWTIVAFFALLPFTGALTAGGFFRIAFILMGVAMVLFLLAYSRIAVIVKSHRRRIHMDRETQETTTGITTTITSQERRKAYTIAIIVSFALFSYLPLATIFILRGVIGDSVEIVSIADTWADFFLHLNSLANPTIYCFRSEEIRVAIKRIMPERARRVLACIFK